MRLSTGDLNLLRPEYESTCKAARRLGWLVTGGLSLVFAIAIGAVYFWRGVPLNAIVDETQNCVVYATLVAVFISIAVGWGIVTPLKARLDFKEGEALFDACWATIHGWLPMRVVRLTAAATLYALVPASIAILADAELVDDRVLLAGPFRTPHSYAEITELRLEREATMREMEPWIIIRFNDGAKLEFHANRYGASVEAIADFVSKRSPVPLQKSKMLP